MGKTRQSISDQFLAAFMEAGGTAEAVRRIIRNPQTMMCLVRKTKRIGELQLSVRTMQVLTKMNLRPEDTIDLLDRTLLVLLARHGITETCLVELREKLAPFKTTLD